MGEFEAYAQSVTAGLDLSEAAKTRIAEEVVAHLEDEARRCVAEGMSPAEAQRAALERFGKEQIIGQLIAGALEQKQSRFRQWRAAKTAALATTLVIVSLAVGAWFTVFNDAVAGQAFMESLPRLVGPILYLGGATGCLAVLAVVIAPLFRVHWVVALSSFIAMVLISYASMSLFHALPALRETIGTIRLRQSEYTSVVNAFWMKLYLGGVPTVATGIIVAIVSRRRSRVLWLAVPFALGLLSAVLWGFNRLSHPAPWMYWMKWPKLLSTGLTALVFVILTGLLARAVAERFQQGRNPAGCSWRDEPSTPEDSTTPVQAT